jgi:hypothetical protein
MMTAQLNLNESLMQFLEQYQLYGFKDQNELICTALNRLYEQLEQQKLRKSATLYAEIYETDPETQKLTQSALSGWPT